MNYFHRFAYLLLLICSFLFLLFNPQVKAANIDSLKVCIENQQGEERLKTMLLLGKAYQKTNRNESIVIFKDACLLIPENDLKQSADIAYKIAYNYFKLPKNDSAIAYYNFALLTYKELLDTLNIMKTSTMIGLAYQHTGEFGESAKHLKEGIDLFVPYWLYHEGEPNISKRHLAAMMTNYGNVLDNIGQVDSALYYATEAYKIKVEIGLSSKQIGKSLVNIGTAYMMGNKNEESIKYFLDAKELFIPIGDSFNIKICYNNIGMANNRMGDSIEAIKNYEKSLEISRALNSKSEIASTLINLSGLYARMGETDKAENFMMEGLKIGNEIGDKQVTSTANQNLSMLNMDKGNLEKALEYAKSAKNIIDETNELDLLEENTLLLSNIYERLGDYKLSLQYHKEYKYIEVYK